MSSAASMSAVIGSFTPERLSVVVRSSMYFARDTM